jgi:hypothetical protein
MLGKEGSPAGAVGTFGVNDPFARMLARITRGGVARSGLVVARTLHQSLTECNRYALGVVPTNLFPYFFQFATCHEPIYFSPIALRLNFFPPILKLLLYRRHLQ